MSRFCQVSLKKPLVGNNVSHANNKNKRVFLPNIRAITLYSVLLSRAFHVKLSVRGLKTIEKKGGLDGYIKTTPARRLKGVFALLNKEIRRKGL